MLGPNLLSLLLSRRDRQLLLHLLGDVSDIAFDVRIRGGVS